MSSVYIYMGLIMLETRGADPVLYNSLNSELRTFQSCYLTHCLSTWKLYYLVFTCMSCDFCCDEAGNVDSGHVWLNECSDLWHAWCSAVLDAHLQTAETVSMSSCASVTPLRQTNIIFIRHTKQSYLIQLWKFIDNLKPHKRNEILKIFSSFTS